MGTVASFITGGAGAAPRRFGGGSYSADAPRRDLWLGRFRAGNADGRGRTGRSEEHTSELQSRGHLVCRLLLEKKKLLQYARRSLNARLNLDHDYRRRHYLGALILH